ncbi:type II secretion system protein [Clostridium grantii]|uniref:Prepilin-type N-terminal cleavage/methylation domain-containing protein n=1 Tax=Clostridium grantii DSM 8605 TaxID=1121316 RepID=A0A1M5RHX0_9CLOT|nr:type II secretion system protein [Clostridium grantii]SHH25927.1 prepilin-type N-terminal cleavage/methylation domain-containing protein [Clostridium grantii DSM 8605]
MKNRRKSKGVTLLELIISIALLGIIITPVFSLVVTSAKINGKSEDEIQALALGQQKFEFLKNSKDVTSGITGPYEENGFSVTEKIIELSKYEVLANEGSNNSIPEENVINIEVKSENNNYILYASNNNKTINYQIKNSDKIKIFYKNDNINFENNSTSISIPVNSKYDVNINFINNTVHNFEVTFNNQNYNNSTDKIYIFYTVPNTISVIKDGDGIMNSNEKIVGNTGESGQNMSFSMYKIIVEVKDESKVYQTFEGYKPIYN